MMHAALNNPLNDWQVYRRWHRTAASIWLAVVCALMVLLAGLVLVWHYPIDSRVFSLLPEDQRHPLAEAGLQALAEQGEKQMVIVFGASNRATALDAAHALRQRLKELPLVEEVANTSQFDLKTLTEFYAPYRYGLMTVADSEWLQKADDKAASERALARAYSVFGANLTAWKDDPFGFYNNWLIELGKASPLRPDGDVLMRQFEKQYYAVLILRAKTDELLTVSSDKPLAAQLDQLLVGVHQQHPETSILRSGFAWHAAAATSAARHEIALIGGVSLLASLLLIFFVFRNFAALRLVLASLVAGVLVALPITWLVFGSLHLVTLTFSASLIGVAVDYGILITTKRLRRSPDEEQAFWQEHRTLLPSMLGVLIAPAVAYGGILLLPFPGLQQMALFAILGIAAAWLTIMLGYPYLLPRALRTTSFSTAAIARLRRLPRWRRTQLQVAISAGLLLVIGYGIFHLRIDDNVRHLISTDQQLVAEQIQVSQLLQLPSPAQMFLVTGKNPEEVLQREEGLMQKLAPFVQRHQLSGFDHVTRWLPSLHRQEAIVAAQSRLTPVRKQLAAEWDLTSDWVTTTPLYLTYNLWRAAPVAAAAEHLWLRGADGQWATMVLLKGLNSLATIPQLAELATDNITFVDKPGEISQLMQHFRERMTWVIFVAYLLVPLALVWFYRKKVWRVVVPSLLATLATLAIMGFCGIPYQMIAVLALLLVFGMGMDYGLFLVSQDRDARSLLSISVAALLTLCSFGLLAASSMPVLRVLGQVVTIGVALAWGIMLWFRSDTYADNEKESIA